MTSIRESYTNNIDETITSLKSDIENLEAAQRYYYK